MDFSIEQMPLSTTDCFLNKSDNPCGFHVRSWVPCAKVSKALIVLDDELIGDIVLSGAKALLGSNEIAPLAIYFVGFDENRFGALHKKRAKYLTMQTVDLRAVGIEETGSGEDLFSFLKQTIVPLISDSHRDLISAPALAGYSLSGLFVLLAACDQPDLFGDIAAISPSLFLDQDMQEKCFELMQGNLERRLFLAAGALENDRALTGLDQDMHELVAALGASLSSDFGDRIVSTIYKSQTHSSSAFYAAPMMLRYLFGETMAA